MIAPETAPSKMAEARKSISRKDLGRLALTGAAMGFALIPADTYWGKQDGLFGCFILGVLVLGGLLFNFFSAIQSLTNPRRLDFPFVAGIDYAGRKAIALRSLYDAAWRQTGIPILAGLVLGIARGFSLSLQLGVAGLFALESLVVTSVLLLIVRMEWLPLSKRKFAGENTSRLPDLGVATASLLIRATYALAAALTTWLPDPYRWLLRRKLLYLLRMDTVFLGIFALFLIVLGTQLLLASSLFSAGIFSLTGTMVTLTTTQITGEECEAYYHKCGYFLPRPWFNYRANLLLMLMISAIFSCYFILAGLAHMGFAGALHAQGFWQGIVTTTAFPFLLMAEKPGLINTSNSRTILNFSYLGIAGILFMFPVWGLVLAGGVGTLSAFLCLRIARPAVFLGNFPNRHLFATQPYDP